MNIYRRILTTSWYWLFLQFAAAFIVIHLIFADFYAIGLVGMAGPSASSPVKSFLFSLWMPEIAGRRTMLPQTLYTNVLLTLESFVNTLAFALLIGVTFVRFSRPTSRLRFSEMAAIALFDGVKTLTFRFVTQRGEAIVDATVAVTLVYQDTTQEGITMRRFHELKIAPANNSFSPFRIMHPIDRDSPLFDLSEKEMKSRDMEIVVILNGLNEISTNPVHVRHVYRANDIAWDRRFTEVNSHASNGDRSLNFTRPNDTTRI